MGNFKNAGREWRAGGQAWLVRVHDFVQRGRGAPFLKGFTIWAPTSAGSVSASTTTTTGLRVRARLDTTHYPSGLKVSRDALDAVRLRPDAFHEDWNYTILSTQSAKRKDLVHLFRSGPLAVTFS